MPNRKVSVGALAGALTVIAVFAVQQTGITIPAEVAAAVTTVVSFALSYLVPNPS